jgi:hypothetical protein
MKITGAKTAKPITKKKMKSFDEQISTEVDYLGGGYFIQLMFTDGRLDPKYKEMYSSSGETHMDLDRLNWGDDDNPAWLKFWDIIDLSQAATKWPWNYKGGSLEPQLKKLVSQIIFPRYTSWCKKYLSPKSLEIVNSDDRLIFNFIYAVFNGIGWFSYFSDAMNIYVDKQGITDKKILMNKMVEERINNKWAGKYHIELIEQGGNTIKELMQKGII